jgi:very-short-patch-repair endonuclease
VIEAAERRYEADCAWIGPRLIAELDGRATHATRRAFERDRARDRALLVAGWRTTRVTWRQLHGDPDGLAEDLQRLLD